VFRSRIVLLALLVALLSFTVSFAQDTNPVPTLRDDLAVYHRPIKTTSKEAQRWFDQGLVLYYGFNHDAAIACFKKVAELDPKCAMAWWGQAISAGPNINNPHMDETAAKNAYDAAQQAKALSGNASPVEQKLIDAIATRYAWPVPEDRKALDVAYSDAMRNVWKQYPKDKDVGALFADASMNLRPWDLWSPNGQPRPEEPEIQATIEAVLRMDPKHIMACHEYIHTMEASPTPEKALPAANVLRTRVPGAGHLVHMPAHIDMRLGHYNDAILANQKGVEVDKTWAAQGGFYTFYRAHNFHFLSWAAMFDGRKKLAVDNIKDFEEQIPVDLARAFPDFIDAYMGSPVEVYIRFGMWNDILALPKPPADLQAWTAFWRYGRTVAYASLDSLDAAAKEFDTFKTSCAAVPDTRILGNNPAITVLDVGLAMAEGELEYRRGNYDHAFELLRDAVKKDLALHYDEPWGWMMPASHALGALLLDRGRGQEAEEVYRADLKRYPMNGWSLHGLSESLRAQGKEKEASAVDAQFRKAWARADVTIQSSCYCRKGS
jgi:tetratricopeptide (TPR) repeat protein